MYYTSEHYTCLYIKWWEGIIVYSTYIIPDNSLPQSTFFTFSLDGTVYNSLCTQAADSCTYLNAKCLPSGICGCEDGLMYDQALNGCCKLFFDIKSNKTNDL